MSIHSSPQSFMAIPLTSYLSSMKQEPASSEMRDLVAAQRRIVIAKYEQYAIRTSMLRDFCSPTFPNNDVTVEPLPSLPWIPMIELNAFTSKAMAQSLSDKLVDLERVVDKATKQVDLCLKGLSGAGKDDDVNEVIERMRKVKFDGKAKQHFYANSQSHRRSKKRADMPCSSGLSIEDKEALARACACASVKNVSTT